MSVSGLISSFVISGLIALPITIASVRADDGEAVQVRIRSIEGLQTATVPEIPPELSDISEKLHKLNYKGFRLLESYDERIDVLHKKMISLSHGETLTIRPLYVELGKGRTGVWLKWQDRNGESILDSRMHFQCGQSVVTGTDRSTGSGALLAIDVHPQGGEGKGE